MSNLRLTVQTQGVKGGNMKNEEKGYCLVETTNDNGQSVNKIWIDAFTGTGRTYQPRTDALINIVFANGRMFSGTFEQLYEKLNLNLI